MNITKSNHSYLGPNVNNHKVVLAKCIIKLKKFKRLAEKMWKTEGPNDEDTRKLFKKKNVTSFPPPKSFPLFLCQ